MRRVARHGPFDRAWVAGTDVVEVAAVHERLSGLIGKGTGEGRSDADDLDPERVGAAANGDGVAAEHTVHQQPAGAAEDGSATARQGGDQLGAAELEHRARELEQRAVDLDQAVRDATVDLTAARRGGAWNTSLTRNPAEPRPLDEPTEGRVASSGHRHAPRNPAEVQAARIRELEVIVADLRRQAEECHRLALAARLRADDAVAPHPPEAAEGAEIGERRGTRSGRAGDELEQAEEGDPPTIRHDGRAEWTQLLEAAIEEPSTPTEGAPGAAPGTAREPGAQAEPPEGR
jgi:hypothetical protein